MTNFEAIPNYTNLRLDKDGYDKRYQIDETHPLHNDPLVDLREDEFGFHDASSYYSKPNRMTGETLPGVPNAPLVRLDIARRLLRAENFLQNDPDVREVLGTAAHIRVDDALRTHKTQKFAFEVAWPEVIKSSHPELSDEEILEMVPKYCARPSDTPTPTPHSTGGAADVALINLDSGEAFDRGHKPGAVKGTAYPDFHEGYHLTAGLSDIEDVPEQAEVAPPSSVIVMARRVLHYAMTNVAGLYVNPNEIWHYGKGDPLSAYVSGDNNPYYGIAELPEGYFSNNLED